MLEERVAHLEKRNAELAVALEGVLKALAGGAPAAPPPSPPAAEKEEEQPAPPSIDIVRATLVEVTKRLGREAALVLIRETAPEGAQLVLSSVPKTRYAELIEKAEARLSEAA